MARTKQTARRSPPPPPVKRTLEEATPGDYAVAQQTYAKRARLVEELREVFPTGDTAERFTLAYDERRVTGGGSSMDYDVPRDLVVASIYVDMQADGLHWPSQPTLDAFMKHYAPRATETFVIAYTVKGGQEIRETLPRYALVFLRLVNPTLVIDTVAYPFAELDFKTEPSYEEIAPANWLLESMVGGGWWRQAVLANPRAVPAYMHYITGDPLRALEIWEGEEVLASGRVPM